jgi:hypothetical protein
MTVSSADAHWHLCDTDSGASITHAADAILPGDSLGGPPWWEKRSSNAGQAVARRLK